LLWRAEEGFAVAAAEQENEPAQVSAQLAGVVGRVADEVFQRRAEAAGIALEPAGIYVGRWGFRYNTARGSTLGLIFVAGCTTVKRRRCHTR
jgi:hypothetical protein